VSNEHSNGVSIINLLFNKFSGDGQYDRPSIAPARDLDASVFSGAEQKRKHDLPSFQFKVYRYNYYAYYLLLESIIVTTKLLTIT